ncbi:MAG TPA: ribonuclease R [Anaeromyxobacter sp.]|nr:ribonuclease R [Anaeromyxobacter sp.]
MARDQASELRTVLLTELRRAPGRPISVQEIMSRAHIHPGERTAVKRALRDLAREGILLRDAKRFRLPGAPGASQGGPGRADGAPERQGPRLGARPLLRGGKKGEVLGTLKKHRDGFGFVARLDRKGDDVFLPPDEAARALDGDLVRVEIVPARGGRTAGRLVEVVERRRRLLIGTYHARGRASFVVPADAELSEQVPVPETDRARDGEVVKVALDPGSARLVGEVVEAIGRPGEPRVEVLRVAYARGFGDVFPDEVRAEAEATPDHVTADDRAGRRDLTHLPLVTIDGEDARDFDDAVYVERLPPGKGKGAFRLVVAIADVAHYVRTGRPLDVEAARRGTSVYFPAQVLPMLPERLSNGICSLNPEVDRLCMVADLTLDAHGHTTATEVYEGVMRSAARCTYTEVARVLAGERVPGREAFRPMFELMGQLQQKLTAMRRARGALDFDLPEAKIVLDAEGRITNIEKRPRNQAHRVVEEFMLAANEAVARWFGARELPTIYRVHGLPDEEKLAAFLELAAQHGFGVPELPPDPRELNALLGQLQGHAQQRALNQLLLRAMMQAVYAPENIGHYGLAAEHYLHFTSPIRRYPDLVVHRLLKEEWAARQGRTVKRTPAQALEEIAALSSERERAAMEAEREIAGYYAALLMNDRIGEAFDGVVSAVTEFGFFVELRPMFVEGLVRAEDLGGAFELDPVRHALVDVAGGAAFRVGDDVRVEVANASPARRQVTLRLLSAAGQAAGDAAGAPAPRRRSRRGAARDERAGRGKRPERRAGRPEPRKAQRKGRGPKGPPPRGAKRGGKAGGRRGRR